MKSQTYRDKADTAAIAIYVRHAQRFGTTEVMSAAIEADVPFTALVLLREQLDELEEKAAKAKRFGSYSKPRLSAETRVKRLLGIEDEDEKEV